MKRTALLCLALLLSTSSASADRPDVEIVELKYLPPCAKIETRNDVEYCIYSLADFRDKVAKVDLDLQKCEGLRKSLEEENRLLLMQRRLLQEQLNLEADIRKLYEERSRELANELIFNVKGPSYGLVRR